MLQLKKAALPAAPKHLKLVVNPPEINLRALEEGLARQLRESNFADAGRIYKKIYAQSDRPERIQDLLK